MDKIKEIIGRAFKSEQEKRLMGAAVLVLIGLCIFIMAISPLVGASPIITLNGEEEMLVECGSEFVDPGVKATAKDEDISDLVMTTGNVDTSKLGTYHVEYQLKYKKRKVSKERIVKVIDHAAPVIALNGDATVIVGSFEEYQEAGATAQDGCDGDVSKDIKITKEKVNDYVKEEATYYAKWIPNTYTLKLEVNGKVTEVKGSFNSLKKLEIPESNYKITYDEREVFIKRSFKGWVNENNETAIENYIFKKDEKLKAIFEDTVNVQLEDINKENNICSWNTKKSGNGESYDSKTTINIMKLYRIA